MNENKDQSADDAKRAKEQLDLVLSFFARVDTKLSVVLGINLAMLGVLFTKAAQVVTANAAVWVLAGVFVALVARSAYDLYQGSFPNLDGGSGSLVYFAEIAKLRESEFLSRFAAMSDADLAHDRLEQTWRNSKILSLKFASLKSAYLYMAWAGVPWALCLLALAAGSP